MNQDLITKNDRKTTVIEINGIKLEVDLTSAKVINEYKVGDNIKVLIKNYSGYESHAGVIVGFDNFKELPTMIIAYCETGYSTANIKFIYLNAQTKDVEICHMNHGEKVLDKHRAVEYLDREILNAEVKLNELKMRKNYFLEQYGMIFNKNLE